MGGNVTAAKVRADYEQLKVAADRFGRQAQVTRQTLLSLHQAVDMLQGGDWVGQGASAFYQEMWSTVMPAVQRLVTALESAQHATSQISQIMAQAEADAARVLRGDGVAGSRSELREFGPAAGAAVGGGAPVPPSPAARSPVAQAMARKLAAENAAVDQKLSQFSPGMRALVKQSPTLRAEILQLAKGSYTISLGSADGGLFTDPDLRNSRIVIPNIPNATDANFVSSLAHEVSHATHPDHLVDYHSGMPRDEFVEPNVQIMVHGEGEAQFNGAQVRAEIIAAGGPDIGMNGSQTAAFEQVYADYTAGRLSHDQAVERMAGLMAHEHVSVPPHDLYPDHYRTFFNYEYDVDFDDPPPPSRRP
jgi:WXG100 family type VII secretion target